MGAAAPSLAAWRLYHPACLLEQILDDVLLASPGRLRVEPYQLVPLMRALELPRPRLLLADGVGLGKTIEVGLIACELIARRRAHRVLVVSPAGPLLVQWAQEMRQRFGLRFTAITDAAALQQQRRRLELGGNPFHAISLCLVSLDFAKQERVLEELERSAWDLAIIDEAHHCIGSAATVDREDTQRRRLAEVIRGAATGCCCSRRHPPQPAAILALKVIDPATGSGHFLVEACRYLGIERHAEKLRDRPMNARRSRRCRRRGCCVVIQSASNAGRHSGRTLLPSSWLL